MDAIITAVTDFVWGPPLIILVLAVGLLLTVGSGFFQFRHFGHIMKNTFGLMLKRDDKEGKGLLKPFQAASAAVGSAVGVGNVGGVATAIATGGPGAVFWLWVCALIGMMTKFTEVTLAVHYRSTDSDGNPYGGPSYYMEKGLGEEKGFKLWGIPAVIFGGGIFATFFFSVQNYTVSEAVSSTFGINMIVVSVAFCILAMAVVLGGIARLGKVAEKLVPLMCLFYVVGGLFVIFRNVDNLPSTFRLIFESAFTGTAAVGGFLGAAFMQAMQTGVARSVYSNEAGWGTSPMLHSTAKTPHPVKQGLWGSFEVFVDTMIVCTITALAIINTGAWSSGLAGAELTLEAFEINMGFAGRAVVAISIFLFGVTTEIGWYAYYEILLRHLLRKRPKLKDNILKVFRVVFAFPSMLITIFAVVYGMPSGLIWSIADVITGIPTFVNLLTVLFLSHRFFALLRDYKARNMGIGTIDPGMCLFYEDKLGIRRGEA
ncbi:MAG: sodium:alanine symporter family protein [Clostridiales Family XIII bacterium]|jgi:AGCS family alanine or glycine:cation symporter|nr:sodium:alanine symporter family protein [Clostridiales Family XIII bacterium]